MHPDDIIIQQTKKWIIDVVIGCNFCPFAAREMKNGTVSFKVIQQADTKLVLETMAAAFQQLDMDKTIETTLLILPKRFPNFLLYLDLLDIVQSFLNSEGKEGVYQLASFHPAYKFAGTTENDPANYTNRSPFPIIQILREASITKVTKKFKDIEGIPDRNVAFANQLGLEHMIALRNACLEP